MFLVGLFQPQCDPDRDFCLFGLGFSTQAVWKGTWAQKQAPSASFKTIEGLEASYRFGSASGEGRGLSCLLLGADLPMTLIHDGGTLMGKDKTGCRAGAEGGGCGSAPFPEGPGPLAVAPGSTVPTTRLGLFLRRDPRLWRLRGRRARLPWVGVQGESGPCGPDPRPRSPRTLRRSGRENWGSHGSHWPPGNALARPQPTRRPRSRVPPRVCRLLRDRRSRSGERAFPVCGLVQSI